MANEPKIDFISALGDTYLVESGRDEEGLFDIAANDPEKFGKIYDKRIKNLTGWSAERPTSSTDPLPVAKR